MPDPSAAGRASGHAKRSGPVMQILAMQARLFARVMDDATPAKEQAACSRAWKELETQKRQIKGLPNPAPVRSVSAPKKRVAREVGPVEPTQSEPVKSEPLKPTQP
jgi:hypothetical protein